jgi:hypothetical protein
VGGESCTLHFVDLGIVIGLFWSMSHVLIGHVCTVT